MNRLSRKSRYDRLFKYWACILLLQTSCSSKEVLEGAAVVVMLSGSMVMMAVADYEPCTSNNLIDDVPAGSPGGYVEFYSLQGDIKYPYYGIIKCDTCPRHNVRHFQDGPTICIIEGGQDRKIGQVWDNCKQLERLTVAKRPGSYTFKVMLHLTIQADSLSAANERVQELLDFADVSEQIAVDIKERMVTPIRIVEREGKTFLKPELLLTAEELRKFVEKK